MRLLLIFLLAFTANDLILGQCPQLGPINGSAAPQWCAGQSYTYSIPNSANAGLEWQIICADPNAVRFVGDSVGPSVSLWITYEISFTICATATNPCYNPPPTICLDVEPLPGYVMDYPPDITVCEGDQVNVIFNGQGDYYQWGTGGCNPNANPWFGLPTQGIGDLDFIAANDLDQPLFCNIGVAPMVGNCQGHGVVFKIHVNPTPYVHPTSDITVCGGASLDIPITGMPGTVFDWSNDNPAIGLASAGSGDIVFTSANPASTEVGTVVVTPSFEGCLSKPDTFRITVNPMPVLDPLPDLTLCAGDALQVSYNGFPAGVAYPWTNSNPAIGLPASGSGDINLFTAQVSKVENALITVKPQIGACKADPLTFRVQVKPVSTINPVSDVTVCTGDTVSVKFTASPPAVFYWTNTNTAIDLPAVGVGNLLFLAAPVTNTQTATIAVSPDLNGCPAPPFFFQITVNKCCVTFAGNMDTTAVQVCGEGDMPVVFLGKDSLETGDSLHFILYSVAGNPLGSVLYETDTLVFPFLPGLTSLDTTYFVAAIAGNGLSNDSIDRSDKCLSISNAQRVRWLTRPTIQLTASEAAYCGDGCFDAAFAFTGRPPFQLNWVLEHIGTPVYGRSETAQATTLTITVCTADFWQPVPGGAMLDFRMLKFNDADCVCGQ